MNKYNISLPAILLGIGGLFQNHNQTAVKPYLTDMHQLSTAGVNGEAYWSFDGQKLIYQSNRDGYEWNKIYTMNIDGTKQSMVNGAHICSY